MKRKFGLDVIIGDFDDIKALRKLPHNIPFKVNIFEEMTVDEVLERDQYIDEQGNERHELIELIYLKMDNKN